MLRQQPNLGEVNFWAPSTANFRALQPGELFLFKLYAPRNVIVGGCQRTPLFPRLGGFPGGERGAVGIGDARPHRALS